MNKQDENQMQSNEENQKNTLVSPLGDTLDSLTEAMAIRNDSVENDKKAVIAATGKH